LSPTIGSCSRSKGSLGCKVAPDIGEHVLSGMTTSTSGKAPRQHLADSAFNTSRSRWRALCSPR
jgi:hypothetical protein